MYSYIKGILAEKGEGRIVVENHGIGYNIMVSANVMDTLPAAGEQVKIYTYLHVKEDVFALFGFVEKDGLEIFKLLLGVNGVGPKGALAVLAVLSVDELRFAVLAGDAKTIAKAPGIGGKTAQRIILELKDKLNLEDSLGDKEEAAPAVPGRELKTARNDAVQALVALGYASSEALSVVSKVEITEETDVEEILKAALKQMAML